MQSFQAIPASHNTGRIRAALKSAVDEICGTLARLIAYLGTLALMFIVGVYLWDQLPSMRIESPAQPDWILAPRSTPAFASNTSDLSYKSKTYRIFRHPEGGRRDVLRWDAGDGQAVAELEIYRPGGEDEPAAVADVLGTADSKFGPVALLRTSDSACLGFLRAVDQPTLRLSGYVCQGETAAARNAAVSCLLNRLSLVAAGNDAKLAELFARADLKRADCRTDWVSSSDKPGLRGAM